MATAYHMNYGNVYGGPVASQQSAPSWGCGPSPLTQDGASTATGGPSPYGSYPSQDSYPSAFAQSDYQDPEEAAKEAKQVSEKKERKKKKRKKDARSATEVLLFLGVLNTILWVLPCFGSGWHQKDFNGFGVGYTKLRTGLFTVTLDVECFKMEGLLIPEWLETLNPDHLVCRIFSEFKGTHSMHAMKDLACAMDKSACNVMESIFYCSFFLIFAFVVSALLSFVASMFLYFYWYHEHLKVVRLWACGMYFASPCFGIMAFGLYTLLMPDIGELPRTWTTFARTFNGGTGIGEIRPIGEDVFYNRYGWCWFFVFITTFSSLAAPIAWGCWFKKHFEEKGHEKAARKEIEALEDHVEQIEMQTDEVETGVGAGAYQNWRPQGASGKQSNAGGNPAQPPQWGTAPASYPPQSGAPLMQWGAPQPQGGAPAAYGGGQWGQSGY